MDYVEKTGTGETILKGWEECSCFFLAFLLAFGSGNNLSLVMKGSSDKRSCRISESERYDLQPAGGKQCDGSGGQE